MGPKGKGKGKGAKSPAAGKGASSAPVTAAAGGGGAEDDTNNDANDAVQDTVTVTEDSSDAHLVVVQVTDGGKNDNDSNTNTTNTNTNNDASVAPLTEAAECTEAVGSSSVTTSEEEATKLQIEDKVTVTIETATEDVKEGEVEKTAAAVVDVVSAEGDKNSGADVLQNDAEENATTRRLSSDREQLSQEAEKESIVEVQQQQQQQQEADLLRSETVEMNAPTPVAKVENDVGVELKNQNNSAVVQSNNHSGDGAKEEKEVKVVVKVDDDDIVIDKFGFVVSLTEHEKKSDFLTSLQRSKILTDEVLKFRKEKSSEREKKWMLMVEYWKLIDIFQPFKIKRRVVKGIPDSFRGQKWYQFVGGDYIKSYFADPRHPWRVPPRDKASAGKSVISDGVNINVESLSKKVHDEINRDIDRTFPRHVYFMESEGKGQCALRLLLQRYAVVDPQVGYCQGMAFIAAVLLTYESEENAFYIFYGMLQQGREPLRTQFLEDMLSCRQKQYVFHMLGLRFLPQLFQHLEEQNIHPTMYATEWFMTIFCRGFSFDLVTRVFDIFTYKGYKIVYRVALALLESIQEQILSNDFENIMKIFRSLPTVIDAEKVIELAMNYKFTTKDCQELVAGYSDEKFWAFGSAK